MLSKPHVLLLLLLSTQTNGDFDSDLAAFIKDEMSCQRLDPESELTEDETRADEYFLDAKMFDFEVGRNPKTDFLQTRDSFEQSDTFRAIRYLPKGASLCGRYEAMLSVEVFIKNITYIPKLYACAVDEHTWIMRFFPKEPPENDEECYWISYEQLRRDSFPESIDHLTRSQLSIDRDRFWLDDDEDYGKIEDIHMKTDRAFGHYKTLLSYKKAMKWYMYLVLEEFFQDGVLYMEMRYIPWPTFGEDEENYTVEETLQYLLDVVDNFKKENPDFVGIRFIYCIPRNSSTFKDEVDQYLDLLSKFPDLFIGVDLIGREDRSDPIEKNVAELQRVSEKSKLLLTAGETSWWGIWSDLNPVDAILLNTTRLGGGFSVHKHPKVTEVVKEKNIPVEISPIGDQVFKYTDEFANHPGASLIATGVPVVICPGSPTLWRGKGMSYDYFVAYMTLVPRTQGLRFLKQLVESSLNYTRLEGEEKKKLNETTWKRWHEFVAGE